METEERLKLKQKFGLLGMKWKQTDYFTLDEENAEQCAMLAEEYATERIKEAVPMILQITKDELLKQTFFMVHDNGYPSEAVPKATILSLKELLSDGIIEKLSNSKIK